MNSVTSQSKKDFIERFGLEAIPNEQKNTAWYRFAFIQIAISANAGNFLIPALAVLQGKLSFFTAILTTSIGAIFGFIFVSLLSIPGGKYGIPAQYSIRSMLGVRGAKFLSSPIRSITSLYWFSVQTIGGTYVLQQLILRLSGRELPFLMLSVPLSLIMALLAIIGFQAVKRMTTFFLPILLIGEGTMLYIFSTNTWNQNSLWHIDFYGSPSMIIFYASLAFVQYVSGVSASADITRYAKTTTHGALGLLIGNSVGFLITAIIGAGSAFLSGEINPYVSTSNATHSPLLLSIITLTAIISMLSINMSNAYTGGYSLLNTFSSLTRLQSSIAFGTLGIIFSSFPALVYQAQDFISALGGFIIPISGVIVADYLFIKKLTLTPFDLEGLTHMKSLNKKALAIVLLGSLFYFVLPDKASPGFLTFFSVIGAYVFLSHILKGENGKQLAKI